MGLHIKALVIPTPLAIVLALCLGRSRLMAFRELVPATNSHRFDTPGWVTGATLRFGKVSSSESGRCTLQRLRGGNDHTGRIGCKLSPKVVGN